MTLRKDHSQDNSTTAEAGAHVTNVRIDLGGTTLAVVTVLVAIIGTCGVVIGVDIAERATMSDKFQDLQRQYRMTELKLDDWTVVAHRSGLALPGDYARGPQGNLDRQSFEPPLINKANPFIAIPPMPAKPYDSLCGPDNSLCTHLNSGKKQ